MNPGRPFATLANVTRGHTSGKLGLSALALLAGAGLSACGSQRDSARVAAMIEAKYGVNVVGCSLDQGSTAASPKRTGLWSCALSAPRTDKATGVSASRWCVTHASPDNLYESADLAYPRPARPHVCQ